MSKLKPKPLERVFEARYERGYRYLDRCGDVIAVLEEMLTADTGALWLPSEMTPTGARLKCPDWEVEVLFDTGKLVVMHRPVELTRDLGELADSVLSVIIGRFDLKEFSRFGSRQIHLVPADSIEEAQALSVSLSPFTKWPKIANDNYSMREASATVVHENTEQSVGYRVETHVGYAFDAPEKLDPRLRTRPSHLPKGQYEALLAQLQRKQQREKAPLAGVVIDVDYYQMWPKNLTPKQFLATAESITGDILQAVLAERGSQ